MSNHAHFIIRSEIQILSRFMAAVLSEYALYYNFKHQRNGHVFQNRFASECIENEKYFWMCLRYIHLNPVKAGMVNNLSKYKYSSVNEYRSNTAIVIHEKALLMYKKTFPDAKSFEEFHRERETKVFLDISEEMLTQRVELAIDYAESLQTKHNLPVLSQVFEEKDIRLAYIAYSAKSAHPFRRNGAPFRLKLSNAQLVISYFDLHGGHALEIPIGRLWMSFC